MKRIDKLTPEQEAMIPAWVDKWIKIGLQTGETDWETFDKYMPICYEKAGLKYPTKVIRIQSPLVGAFASSIADNILNRGEVRDAVGRSVEDAIRDAIRGAVAVAVRGAVRDAVGRSVEDAIRGAVAVAVRGAVGDAVGDAVGVAVGDAVGDEVRGEVRVAVEDAVRVAVGDAVRGAVRDVVGGAVGGAVRDVVGRAVGVAVRDVVRGAVDEKLSWYNWLGGQFWVGGWWWGSPSFVSFFTDVCGLELDKDIQERATAYRKVCESVNYIWTNKDFVMVCARPKTISRDEDGRLHCDTGKAIEYQDGYGLYLLHGVTFEEDLWKKVVSKKMPFEEILAIEDVDQRTQAMKYGDAVQFLKHAKAELLDEKVKYTKDNKAIGYSLHKIPKGDIFTTDAYYALYVCPSTGEMYMSGVPQSKTVAEAMSWKMSDEFNTVSPLEWEEMVPLINES